MFHKEIQKMSMKEISTKLEKVENRGESNDDKGSLVDKWSGFCSGVNLPKISVICSSVTVGARLPTYLY